MKPAGTNPDDAVLAGGNFHHFITRLAFQGLLALGVRNFRVEFLNETPDEVERTIAKYRQLLRGEISGTQLWRELKLFNQLGVTRGQMGK